MIKIAVSQYPLTKKIPPGDSFWATFNAGFENGDLQPWQIVDAVYTGRSITTQHKNHWRTAENYLCGQHLGLDFDSEDENSTIAHLAGDKFIRHYASFIHTTISHKPDAPRARVIFLLDTPIMQAKNYALAATSLLWLYGTADRQCKDAVRFFYGAMDCQMEIIGKMLPLEIVKKLIENYQSSGLVEKHQATRRDYAAPASMQEVQTALNLIPPWAVDYDEWAQILMGLHSEFGYDALSLACSWADGKPGEVEQKFKSFHEMGNTAGRITIATVFGIAKKFGWRKQ